MIKIFNCSAGFTLIELLIVMAILGILASVGISTFQISQAKSRDAQRKSDLEQLQRALEMYYNDYSNYPQSGTLVWGEEFKDEKNTVYMKELPQDPTGNPSYCYNKIENPVSYKIYAKLENSKDPKIAGPYNCGGNNTYNYGVASANTMP